MRHVTVYCPCEQAVACTATLSIVANESSMLSQMLGVSNCDTPGQGLLEKKKLL